MPYLGDVEAALATVNGFLSGDAKSDRSTAETHAPSPAFRTVLFTDLVGHTEMMQRLGDAIGRDLLRVHEGVTRQTLKQHGGPK